MRTGRGWPIVAILLVGAGVLLRWWRLGEPSLWWDELIEIRMADQPSLWGVVNRVRLGVPYGSGNAGAVPLDYALLWAWMRAVPLPAPEHLERYFRTPSFVWSCLLLPVIGGWTWRTFGRAAGLATLALAAGSVPLTLYAAEARFYSLFCLLVVVNLATFATLVRTPERAGAWLAWGAGAIVLVMTGLFGLLLLPWQAAVLAILLARRRRGGVAALAGVTVVIAGLVALYFGDTNLATRSLRGPTRLAWWPNVLTTLRFFDAGSPALRWALGAAPLAALLVTWRRRPALLGVVIAATLAVGASLPIILSIAEAKNHFFHQRHALFLLPLLLVLLGVAIGGVADAMLSPRWTAPVALGAAIALVAPALSSYARAPRFHFAQVKALHDFRGVAQILRERTRDYEPDDRYLLITTRGRGGHLGNPVLAWYFEWYGIADRVLLSTTARPAETIAETRALCWRRCWELSAFWQRRLGLERPHQHSRAKLRLLGGPVTHPPRPGRLRHVGFAIYAPVGRWKLGPLEGYRAWRRPGLHLYELARPPRH